MPDKESSIEPATGQTSETADSTSSEQHPEGHHQHAHRAYGLELINESRIWYYDQYKRAVTFGIVVIIALIISLSLNTIQHLSRPSPKYFALTNDLRVVELTPIDKANVSQKKLLNWMSETVCRTFTLDFLNYRDVLMGVRPNYTQGCYDSLTKSLETNVEPMAKGPEKLRRTDARPGRLH